MNEKISFDSIINALVQKSNVNKKFANSFVKEMAQVIQEGLLRDNVVTLSGFGIFKLHNVPERSGRNIQTGEPITIAAHRKVMFKPEKQLRALINKNYQHLRATFFNDQDNLESNGVILSEEPLTQPEETFEGAAQKSPLKETTEKEPVLGATIDNKNIDSAGNEEKPQNIEEKEDHLKKTTLIISVIVILTILLLYLQFSGDDTEQIANKESTNQVEKAPASNKENVDKEALTTKKTPEKPPPVQKKVRSVKSHKAEDGDNLWKLATKYYNDGYLWPLILQANKDKIKNPDFIKSGIEISIPAIAEKDDSQLIAKGHLMAYEEYKKENDTEALDHLYVAYKYDKSYVEKFSEEINEKDLQSVKEQLSK
ncbi:MAG: HU family DNA-binding protein [Calditrichaeota bacterium]|nr:MAG: HU family DNA-binding protein [Calditrichota bacterium]MBL1204056.1 HU family DNA-binding protein [Calditrichota bacterium]NOG43887.1 LysM peptidoglycan-binding domain-containing protein [Calditrichota bacterium]